MSTVTGSQESLMERISNLPELVQEEIVRQADLRTQVLISMLSHAGKAMIKRLKLKIPPDVCIKIHPRCFQITFDENRSYDTLGRYLCWNFRVGGDYLIRVDGKTLNGVPIESEENTSSFLVIITRDPSVFTRIHNHLKELFEIEPQFHLRIEIPQFTPRELTRKIPQPMNFATMSFCADRMTRRSVKAITEGQAKSPYFIHIDMRVGETTYQTAWTYLFLYIQRATWLDPMFFVSLGSMLVVLEDTVMYSLDLHIVMSTIIETPDHPTKFLVLTVTENFHPLQPEIFRTRYTFLDYDGVSRPPVFVMPEEYADFFPEKWREIDLSEGKDIVRIDGTRITTYVTESTFVFVQW